MNFEEYEDDSKQHDGEINVSETARRLKKTEGYIYGLLRVGRLEARKTASGRWWVSSDAVERRRKAREHAI
jgi:hypothetical protein